MSTEKIREEFEVWTGARSDKEVWQRGERTGKYKNPVMQNKWEAWQGSRAAIEVELPTSLQYTGSGSAIDACRDAIESLGLKVKP